MTPDEIATPQNILSEAACYICPLAKRYYVILGFCGGSGLINVVTLLKVYGVLP